MGYEAAYGGLSNALYGIGYGISNGEDKETIARNALIDLGLGSLLGGSFGFASAGTAGKAAGNTLEEVDDLTFTAGKQLDEGVIKKANIPNVKVNEILKAPKGARPDTSTYLPSDYINSHLSLFHGGVTKIQGGVPTRPLGSPLGTYVMPKIVADELIAKSGGDVSELEKLLGLDPGELGNSPVRVDIPNPTGIRMPNGNEVGANSQWIPGGYTSGGIPEAIIDQVPIEKLIITEIYK